MKQQIPAVAYYRYSPGGQQTEQSIEGQRRDCEAYAKAHGYYIAKEYIDRHMTGKNTKRPAFQQLLQDAAAGRFQTVIAWKNDRIARNRRDMLNYRQQLTDLGVSLCYAQMDIPKGPEGIILEGVLDSIAEYYSEELAQKVRRGMVESAHKRQAMGGTPPLGLRVVNHKYVPDPHTAPIVRRVYEQYAQGVPLVDICAQLNAQGIRNSRGAEFTKSSLRTVLQNEKYIGVYASHGVRDEEAIEPIIDVDLFDRVQEVVKANRKTGARKTARHEYLLSGLAVCGCCGAPLIGMSGTGKAGDKHWYYYCSNRRRGGTCSLKGSAQEKLEATVRNATVDYVLQPTRLKKIAKQLEQYSQEQTGANIDLQAAQEALKDTKRRINNILSAMEEGQYSKAAAARLAQLETDAAGLEKQIKNLSRKKPVMEADRLEFFLLQMRQTAGEEDAAHLRRLISTMVQSVEVSADQLLIQYKIPGTKKEVVAATTTSAQRSTSEKSHTYPEYPCFTSVHHGGDDRPKAKHSEKPLIIVENGYFALRLPLSA